jgi:endonuclease-8
LATTDLTGVVVREVVSRGKHQLFRFDNDLTLHTHFRMDGVWRIFPHGQRWSGGPAHEIRCVLATAEHDAVGYRLPVVGWS